MSPKLNTITLEFMEPMDNCCRSFDFGNDSTALRIKIVKVLGWSSDKKKFSFEIAELMPNSKYELVVSNFAKEADGNRLAPYLIKFKTRKK